MIKRPSLSLIGKVTGSKVNNLYLQEVYNKTAAVFTSVGSRVDYAEFGELFLMMLAIQLLLDALHACEYISSFWLSVVKMGLRLP